MCVKENVSHISLTTRLLFSSFLPVCKFLFFWVHSRVKNISLFSERRNCRFSWIIECDFMKLCFPGSFHQVDAWKICLGSAQYAGCQEMWGQMCIVPVLLNSKLDLALVCGSWLQPTDHQQVGWSARKGETVWEGFLRPVWSCLPDCHCLFFPPRPFRLAGWGTLFLLFYRHYYYMKERHVWGVPLRGLIIKMQLSSDEAFDLKKKDEKDRPQGLAVYNMPCP